MLSSYLHLSQLDETQTFLSNIGFVFPLLSEERSYKCSKYLKIIVPNFGINLISILRDLVNPHTMEEGVRLEDII